MADGSDDPTRLSPGSLGREERRILAALAVVGEATLSSEELADVAGVADVAPLVEDLRRRGLVRTDEHERHSVLGAVGEDIRRTDDALSTADHLRKNFETLARRGRLTPARAIADAGAILGLSGWLAENEQWEELLELVQTVEASLSIGETVREWIGLLRAGREAAGVLGDVGAEAAMLQKLSTASAAAGDQAAARRYAREAEALQGPPPAPAPRPAPPQPSGPSAARIVLIAAGVVAAAAIGVLVGALVAGGDDTNGSTTAELRVTVTLPEQTVVTVETTTLPAVTVVETETQVVTETETTTETVVTTVPIG